MCDDMPWGYLEICMEPFFEWLKAHPEIMPPILILASILVAWAAWSIFKGPSIELHGKGEGFKSERNIKEIRAFTNYLIEKILLKPTRIIATPSHIYLLLIDVGMDAFSDDMVNLLSIVMQRLVRVTPTQNGVWVSLHYNWDIEEMYNPTLNLYHEQFKPPTSPHDV